MATTCVKDGTPEDYKSSRGNGPEKQDPRTENKTVMSEWLAKKLEEMRAGPPIPPGMKPNPAFNPVVAGSQIRFGDDFGGTHPHASQAALRNMDGHKLTKGNCGQDPDLVPDFVPDK